MGAQDFCAFAQGSSLEAAFRAAHQQATYEHGHGGYSGTLAEKTGAVAVEHRPQTLESAQARADELLSADDERISDKWGPAGAIPVCAPADDDKPDAPIIGWLLFGWASS